MRTRFDPFFYLQGVIRHHVEHNHSLSAAEAERIDAIIIRPVAGKSDGTQQLLSGQKKLTESILFSLGMCVCVPD